MPSEIGIPFRRTHRIIAMTVVYVLGVVSIRQAVMAADTVTSFEFTDLDGTFSVGTAPNNVSFLNGTARTVGTPGLYHRGRNERAPSPRPERIPYPTCAGAQSRKIFLFGITWREPNWSSTAMLPATGCDVQETL